MNNTNNNARNGFFSGNRHRLSQPTVIKGADHLAQLFESAQVGDIVTYEQMAAHMEVRDIREHYPVLYKALRIARESRGFVFKCQHNVGYVRLSEDDKVAVKANGLRKGIRRRANEMQSVLETVDFSRLRNENQVRYHAEYAVAGALRLFSGERAVKKVTKAVTSSDAKTLAVGNVAQLFATPKAD